MRLQHLTWQGELRVPTFSCSACGCIDRTVDAQEVGCFDGSIGGFQCWIPLNGLGAKGKLLRSLVALQAGRQAGTRQHLAA